jgi:serine protease Do
LKAGQWVVAIGSPFGFDHTVTQGIVSAVGRSLPNENYVPFIQTDVPINPGNSGGPLFNLNGEVVGINSQIYTRSGGFMGVSFAIPIDVAMDVSNQLKSGGKVSRGWLGVVIQEVNKDLAESFGLEKPAGALVAQIQDDGPAAKGGLQVGDVILSMNGQPIVMSADLPHLVGALKAGSKPSWK